MPLGRAKGQDPVDRGDRLGDHGPASQEVQPPHFERDSACLYGTAPEPRGIRNTTGINTVSMGANGAALTNYDPLVDAVGVLADNNHCATAAVFSPRSARALGKLKDTTGQPLQPPEILSDLRRYMTGQVLNTQTQGTASGTASDIFVGDWRELLVGIRTTFSVQVLNERYADTGSIGLLAWFRADVLVTRPKAFAVVQGVL